MQPKFKSEIDEVWEQSMNGYRRGRRPSSQSRSTLFSGQTQRRRCADAYVRCFFLLGVSL